MRKQKIIVFGLIAAVAAASFTGCDVKSETSIVGKLVGLKRNEMFQVGELICTTPEYMLVMMNTQNQYKNDLGQNVDWSIKVDEDTILQDFVMEKVKEDITLKYMLAAMAEKHNVTLTTEEKNNIAKAAKEYYSKLTDEERKYTGAGEADVEKVYTNYCLADKIYSNLTEGVGNKISDEEARVIKIQYIRMSTSKNKATKIKSTMKEVTNLVKGGYQEFSKEAKQFSEDDVVEKVIKKNEASERYELEAFNLKDKEISDIFRDGENYYLIYCKESYMKKETESNKKDIISKAKKDYFEEQYKTFLDSVDTDFNKNAAEKINLSDDANVNNTDLNNIYNSIHQE